MQPRARQRSLALVQALNKVQFDATKSVTEQLPQYDLLVREYERSSQTTYPDDLKIASVVAALPPSLRIHIQMALQDDTTFEDVRQRITNKSANDGCLKVDCSCLYDLWLKWRTRVDRWRWMRFGRRMVERKEARKEGRKEKRKASNRKERAAGPKMEERKAKEESLLAKAMERRAKAWVHATTVANQATMPRTVGPRR